MLDPFIQNIWHVITLLVAVRQTSIDRSFPHECSNDVILRVATFIFIFHFKLNNVRATKLACFIIADTEK